MGAVGSIVKKLIAGLVLGLLLSPIAPIQAEAVSKADLWERWLANQPSSRQTVNHDLRAEFLRKYISHGRDGINRLGYGMVKETDVKKLETYLEALEAVSVSRLNRSEQIAYWINLYNALTIKVIMDHYPVKSIRKINISPGWFSRGPWGKKLAIVEGERVSLDDIEHRILRPIWRDPRVHYAVNCASLGCPNLAPVPYTAENAERLLNQGARNYINNPRGVLVSERGLIVSSIYRWFIEDFGGTDQSVIEHLKKYADPDLAARLEGRVRIDGDHYDWMLNDGTIR